MMVTMGSDVVGYQSAPRSYSCADHRALGASQHATDHSASHCGTTHDLRLGVVVMMVVLRLCDSRNGVQERTKSACKCGCLYVCRQAFKTAHGILLTLPRVFGCVDSQQYKVKL